MIELRLHRDLYARSAVDEAVKVYGGYAALERFDAGAHWGVRVSVPGSGTERRERRVAGELANYALGLTVKTRPAAGAGGAP